MESYPKVYHLGSKEVYSIFDHEVIIEEKIDGSQYSVMMDYCKTLVCKSKSCVLDLKLKNGQFEKAIETSQAIAPYLQHGWTYRFEYLAKPRHNALFYDRVPEKYLIGFDIQRADGTFLTYEEKKKEFYILGLETTPCLFAGKVENTSMIEEIVSNTTSVLGKALIEGVVVKSNEPFRMCGKYVSDAFKEVATRKKTFRQTHDIIDTISEMYRTEARWNKAIQHLRDEDKLSHNLKDIPLLIREVSTDIHTECADAIKEAVFKWAWKQISNNVIKGLPDHYKKYLLEQETKEQP